MAEGEAGTVAGTAASGDVDQAQQADREIVTTGTATVVADDPVAAAEQIVDIAQDAGGRVESRRQTEADGDRAATAELTLRVPADEMTDTVDALGEVGEVQDLSIESVDVTGDAQDLDARAEALAASVDRLRTLMENAETTEDLLTAERELTTRQAELESLQSQRARLTDQVAMSTLYVSVVQVAPDEQLDAGGFLGGLRSGWNALVATVNGLVVGVGALLPWLVVAAVLLLVARAVVRARRRRRAAGSGAEEPGQGSAPVPVAPPVPPQTPRGD